MKIHSAKLLGTLLLLFVSLIFCGRLQAQRLFLFAHLLALEPLENNLQHNYRYGAGGEGGGGLRLGGKTFLTGTLGYTLFKHSAQNKHDGITFIPVKLGLRQYVFAKLLFFHADLGLGIVSNVDASGNQSHFSADFGAGIRTGRFEVQADYDGFSTSNPRNYASWVAIKAGLNLGF